MKLETHYKKQPTSTFAAYNFLIFLDTQMHEPKISEKTISEYFGNGVLVYSGEILLINYTYNIVNKFYLSIISPRRFYQRNNFDGSKFSFPKSAVLSHLKSEVLSHFRNRRLCPVSKIGGFVF